MLNLKDVVTNLEEIRVRLAQRANPETLSKISDLAGLRSQKYQEIEALRCRQNEENEKIKSIVAQFGPKSEQMAEARAAQKELSDKIKELEPSVKDVDDQLTDLLMTVPNLPHSSVPVGKDESFNVEISRWGEPPVMDFEPKWHDELGRDLGILDFESGVKIAGARFTVLKGLGARLERALSNHFLNTLTERGYTEIFAPTLINSQSLRGTGQLPKFEEDLFRIGGEWDLYLSPTAEVPLTNLVSQSVLSKEQLPLRMCCYSSCYRSEAGSYGKDTRGYIRQHQFQKVEMVHVCEPETSYEELELLTANAEHMLQSLGLAYRKIVLCSGDMGFGASKTYDLEVWIPSQKTYREISSCSNCEDFQARRMMARYKDTADKKAKPRLVHTLNGSALAIGRALVAVLENYQQKDGSVIVPEVLRPYMGVERIVP